PPTVSRPKPPRRALRAVLALSAAAAAVVAGWAAPARAVDVLTASGLPNPGVLGEAGERLGLSPQQREEIEKLMTAARQEGEPLERAVREKQEAFTKLVRDPKVAPADAEAALSSLLDAEGAMKKLQVRTLIAVRKVLTPEQVAKLQAMDGGREGKRPDPAGLAGLPPRLAEKVARLTRAVESLGVPPTAAMKERGEEINALLGAGKFDAAEAAFDRLAADARLGEADAAAPAVDFSKFAPGDTDIPVLQARLAAVQEKAQRVVSIPQLRSLLVARKAIEAAKQDQDAARVGRILTWAEQALAEKK
ncbi:MAG TPA: periplasmic heavy metal sensor, partial [Humisphaera sp.]